MPALDASSPPPPPAERGDEVHWSDLPAGLAWAFRRAGHAVPALDITYGGDVPVGAGVSSSAAVAVAFALAWRRFGDFDIDDVAVPQLCREMENGYLGVQSGLMDQFASLLGRAGHALFLDCRSLDFERLPVSRDAAVVVFDSGVRRRLSESGFNDRREECRRAVDILEEHMPGIRALRDVDAAAFEQHSHHLPLALRHRARHAVEEMARVLDGADALRRGDLAAFGTLMRRSHLSSRDFYQVSIPELDLLAAAAWPQSGCWGARMMGGGFGGCVAALVQADAATAITQAVGDAFEAAYGRRPPAFTSALADGAAIL
ncbi:MAG: galactokinase [Acidobacteriota bacterium]